MDEKKEYETFHLTFIYSCIPGEAIFSQGTKNHFLHLGIGNFFSESFSEKKTFFYEPKKNSEKQQAG